MIGWRSRGAECQSGSHIAAQFAILCRLTPITPFDAALYQPATVESAEAICLSTFTLIAERSQKASDPGSRRALDQ